MQSVTWLLSLKQQKKFNQAAVAVLLALVSAVKPSGSDNRLQDEHQTLPLSGGSSTCVKLAKKANGAACC